MKSQQNMHLETPYTENHQTGGTLWLNLKQFNLDNSTEEWSMVNGKGYGGLGGNKIKKSVTLWISSSAYLFCTLLSDTDRNKELPKWEQETI